MGVHVILDIDPRGIEARAWAAAYEQTLALLEAWTPRLLGWGWRALEGARVPMYMRSIRCDEGRAEERWSVVGDRESLQTAECQSLYRDLAQYATRRRREAAPDIVVAAARPKNEDTGGPVRVFGDKTQGHPYHHAMLAAAMLVEERFPQHAMVWGDIDRGQAEEARRLSLPILGRELPLPVRVDAPRLIERLSAAYDTDALPAAFERVFLGESDDRHEAVLRAFPGAPGAEPWKRALASYKSPDALGVVRLVISWLNTGRDLCDACRFACLAKEGPQFAPEAFVDTLASTWVAVALPARKALAVFQRPTGASHTVASLLGSFLLDMEAMGRHLTIYLEPAAITESLGQVFGGEGRALAARLLAKSAKLEEQLRARAGDIDRFVHEAHARAGDDTEALTTLRSVDAMGPNQRAWVRVMACKAVKVLERLRSDEPEARAALSDAKQARSLLARVLSENAPVLTEETWDVILAEDDVEVIAFRCALACMHASELHASQVRRALFENAELRRHAMAIGRDPRTLREIEELAQKARASQRRST